MFLLLALLELEKNGLKGCSNGLTLSRGRKEKPVTGRRAEINRFTSTYFLFCKVDHYPASLTQRRGPFPLDLPSRTV